MQSLATYMIIYSYATLSKQTIVGDGSTLESYKSIPSSHTGATCGVMYCSTYLLIYGRWVVEIPHVDSILSILKRRVTCFGVKFNSIMIQD